ncbi:hypothetical protein [Desulfosediminicola ganghwensis]|uniref:hypothetical protein n=1 Tax=Desulfosediminicola ganghwensis TaxID=2569540 RepID=UPI0010ACD759|nr:hypothetical protein [Desulfosediminicola ganghwensis]
MGFSITWCAVRTANEQKILETFELSPTGKTEEFPESAVSMAQLDTGWQVIWCNRYNSPLITEKILADISHDHDVYLCLIEEHVMASSAQFWSGGERKWLISHQGENGPMGIYTAGEIPECFTAIKLEMEKLQQAEGGDSAVVDYLFEVPLKVAQVFVDFRHDEECPHISNGQFTVLTHPTMHKSFLTRLFGK